jgi:hypothetical protein
MLDFPERGGPFKITIWPGVPTSSKRFLLWRGQGPLPGHHGHQANEALPQTDEMYKGTG